LIIAKVIWMMPRKLVGSGVRKKLGQKPAVNARVNGFEFDVAAWKKFGLKTLPQIREAQKIFNEHGYVALKRYLKKNGLTLQY